MPKKSITKHPERRPTHPGAILREDMFPALDVKVMTAAKMLGVSRQTLHRILAEAAPITPAMAARLGKFFGDGPDLWLAMQGRYDVWHAEKAVRHADEDFARGLLEEYLLRHHDQSASCRFSDLDPPDLVCHVDGSSWAVEVTQLHQRFEDSGTAIPHMSRTARLRRFARKLEANLQSDIRMRYTLYLEGPLSIADWPAWKRTTTDAVRAYVQSGQTDRIRLSGTERIWAFPGEAKISSMMGVPFDAKTKNGAINQDIAANISEMIWHALNDKAQKLTNVAGFDLVALVLINAYPLADDISDVRSCLGKIMTGNRSFDVFEKIFFISNRTINIIHPYTEQI